MRLCDKMSALLGVFSMALQALFALRVGVRELANYDFWSHSVPESLSSDVSKTNSHRKVILFEPAERTTHRTQWLKTVVTSCS